MIVSQDICSSVPVRKDSFTDNYDVQSEIGRGKFAVVKRCVHRASGVECAAKFLHKRRRGKDNRQDVLHEVGVLNSTNFHPHIVNLIEVFETSHNFVLVTEYVPGGELFQHIDIDGRIDEATTARLMRQILSSVDFLHDNNILHLDIKPQNILLTDAPAIGHVKLCDFGLARPFNRGCDVVELVGTLDYVAPEVLDYIALDAACDMWSVGVLAYVMLTGHSPFAGDSRQETMLNISQANLEFPDELFADVSRTAVDFIRRLLVRQPSERMTAKQCLAHGWLSSDNKTENTETSFKTADKATESSVDNDVTLAGKPVVPVTITPAASSPSLPRSRQPPLADPSSSSSGQRRALVCVLASDDDVIVNHEPTKKCRCDVGEVKQSVSSVTTTSTPTVIASSVSHDVSVVVKNEAAAGKAILTCIESLSKSSVLNSPTRLTACVDVSVA